MTRPAPPRLASWLLQRLAFGPHRESLIGDIVEQYGQGRSATWYLRQALAAALMGSAMRVRARPRRALRACVLAVTVPWFFATTGWSFMVDMPGHGWVTIAVTLGVFSYCSLGSTFLILNITCLDEPPSLSLIESTRAEPAARRVW